ncbi:MAG: hypothetical protein KatS3mg059_0895 [Thermomicrobiales bacterium]|nr:MAG: hypothetical protein KatS3mg059_0895 [Thermomicrobiales bacterium]
MRSARTGRVVLGVRPEHLALNLRPTDRAIAAEVYLIEDLGNELLVDVRVNGQQMVARLPAGPAPDLGDRVWLTFALEDVHLFDPATEEHIVRP